MGIVRRFGVKRGERRTLSHVGGIYVKYTLKTVIGVKKHLPGARPVV